MQINNARFNVYQNRSARVRHMGNIRIAGSVVTGSPVPNSEGQYRLLEIPLKPGGYTGYARIHYFGGEQTSRFFLFHEDVPYIHALPYMRCGDKWPKTQDLGIRTDIYGKTFPAGNEPVGNGRLEMSLLDGGHCFISDKEYVGTLLRAMADGIKERPVYWNLDNRALIVTAGYGGDGGYSRHLFTKDGEAVGIMLDFGVEGIGWE